MSRDSGWRQLPLPFRHQPRYAAGDFFEGPSNAAAIAWLGGAAAWPQQRLALWGARGSGKTHLLHVWAGRTGAAVLAGGALLPAAAPPTGPLAIDDADAAPPLPLLHLLNAAAEARLPTLLAGRTPPSRWPAATAPEALPDLVSRLRAMTAVEIAAADDDLLRALLARLLAERQLVVPEPVQAWLLQRLPRTPAAMREVAARLDRAALASGRRVTRATAAAALCVTADPGTPCSEDFAAPATLPGAALPGIR